MSNNNQTYSDFEYLLSEKNKKNNPISSIPNLNNNGPSNITGPTLKARKNATLDDFVSMVAEIVSKSLKKKDVEFKPDEGAIIADPSAKLEHPTILYKVISRVPKNERKARFNEDFEEVIDAKNNQTRTGHNWSQRQNCIVQFDVIASDYKTANEVMASFEDLIFTYTGYFKKNGVAELIFEKYYTDTNLDKYRQWLSIRSIQYFIEIEKLITVFDTNIENVGI